MGMLHLDRGTSARSDDLNTLGDVIGTYVTHHSPHAIFGGIVLVGVLRVVAGGFGWTDVTVIALTLSLTGLVEWVLHLLLLHAPDDSRRMTKYKTGGGHREHHLDPQNVGWLMLGWQDATIFLVMLMAWAATWPLLVAWLFGGSILGTYLSALLVSYLMLAHYEWVHLLVHASYRPKSRYYRRLAVNHRLHHYRNEHYWLGVTSNVGDRLLRTLPVNKSDVVLSPTARSLGSADPT
jgi:hypothetical protein